MKYIKITDSPESPYKTEYIKSEDLISIQHGADGLVSVKYWRQSINNRVDELANKLRQNEK